MTLAATLRTLITSDENSEEFKTALAEFKKTDFAYKTHHYFAQCLGVEFNWQFNLTDASFEKLVRLFRENTLKFSGLSEVVVVAGVTGSGKSTLINYLSAVALEKSGDEGLQVVVKKDSPVPALVPIVNGLHSDCLYPLLVKNSAQSFMELPNIHDNDFGSEGLEISTLLIQLALEKLKSIKAVVVMTECSQTGEGPSLRSFSMYLEFIRAQFREMDKSAAGPQSSIPFLYIVSKMDQERPKPTSAFDANLAYKRVTKSFNTHTNGPVLNEKQVFICRPLKQNREDSLDHKAEILMALHNPEYIKTRGRVSAHLFVDSGMLQWQASRLKPTKTETKAPESPKM